MSKSVFIYGSGGHARVIADILASENKPILGFIEDESCKWGRSGSKYDIIGYEEFLGLETKVDSLVIVGIGDNVVRRRIAMKLEVSGRGRFDTAVHASAVIGGETSFGLGTVVMAGTVINSGATIGRHAIINTGACVDHDCRLSEFVHISPGAHLGGGVSIGAGSWIGLGASVINNCRIGRNAIVGMGAVVIRDIPDYWVVAGNPARFMRMNEEKE